MGRIRLPLRQGSTLQHPESHRATGAQPAAIADTHRPRRTMRDGRILERNFLSPAEIVAAPRSARCARGRRTAQLSGAVLHGRFPRSSRPSMIIATHEEAEPCAPAE